MVRVLDALLVLLVLMPLAQAHEVRPSHLLINELQEGTYRIQWKVPAVGDKRLAIEPQFDGRCKSLGNRVEYYEQGAAFQSWSLRCEEGLAGTQVVFSQLESTMVDVLVQVKYLDGREHMSLVRPHAPSYEVPVRDSKVAVFGDYLRLGIEHIFSGFDHLLFVLGMVLLLRNWRRLVWAITGFTLAHSITLALAALDLVYIPGPPVEAIIALSIVFLATEVLNSNISKAERWVQRRPWVMAAIFGLIHGLGFAGALSEYGLPSYAELLSLLAFNLGVELGQLAFVAVLLATLLVLRRQVDGLLPYVYPVATYSIGVLGTYWLVERLMGFYV